MWVPVYHQREWKPPKRMQRRKWWRPSTVCKTQLLGGLYQPGPTTEIERVKCVNIWGRICYWGIGSLYNSDWQTQAVTWARLADWRPGERPLLRGGQVLASSKPLIDWMRPTNDTEGNLFYSVYQFKPSLHSELQAEKYPAAHLAIQPGTATQTTWRGKLTIIEAISSTHTDTEKNALKRHDWIKRKQQTRLVCKGVI